ncbi:MAG: GNAT family N-acetyltransferase [Nonlabens sp.]|uniref:GNAT family N-acetyltransferase n=1 Tax=Nonlabens sp. TaxID=1888209 RepID=UPI003219A96F
MLWWIFLIVSLVIGYQITLLQREKIEANLLNVMKNKHQEISIKKAVKNDFSKVIELLKIAAQDLKDRGINQWDYWLDPPEERLKWVQEGFLNEEFYFVTFNKQVIGMYRLCEEDLLYWGKQKEPAYYIHSFVVIPEYKGLQIGSYVIDQIENQARENNISLLRLDCNATNPGLCQYYIHQGFVKIGEKQMKLSLNNLYEKTLL